MSEKLWIKDTRDQSAELTSMLLHYSIRIGGGLSHK